MVYMIGCDRSDTLTFFNTPQRAHAVVYASLLPRPLVKDNSDVVSALYAVLTHAPGKYAIPSDIKVLRQFSKQ